MYKAIILASICATPVYSMQKQFGEAPLLPLRAPDNVLDTSNTNLRRLQALSTFNERVAVQIHHDIERKKALQKNIVK